MLGEASVGHRIWERQADRPLAVGGQGRGDQGRTYAIFVIGWRRCEWVVEIKWGKGVNKVEAHNKLNQLLIFLPHSIGDKSTPYNGNPDPT